MKRALLPLVVSLFVIGTSFAGESPLVGTWEFVSGKFIAADGTETNLTPAERKAIKILNATHFSIIFRGPDENGGHGGPYSIDGDKYTEQITLASNPDLMGQSYTFTFKLEGDTWRMSGEMPNVGLKLEEVWRRVKPREGS